jgi:hypothetical protein
LIVKFKFFFGIINYLPLFFAFALSVDGEINEKIGGSDTFGSFSGKTI